MGWNYLSIPKLQRFHRWSLEMDTLFHSNECHFLSLLGLHLSTVTNDKRQKYCLTLHRNSHYPMIKIRRKDKTVSHTTYTYKIPIKTRPMTVPDALISLFSAFSPLCRRYCYYTRMWYYFIQNAICKISFPIFASTPNPPTNANVIIDYLEDLRNGRKFSSITFFSMKWRDVTKCKRWDR